MTDKELDFAKSDPELFSKYLDYCNNILDIKKNMIEAHIKELNIDASKVEVNKQFWEDLAAIGAVDLVTFKDGTLKDYLSNKE